MRDPTPARSPGPFQVHLADHYRFVDEATATPGPSFHDYEEAVAWCRRLVEERLLDLRRPGTGAEELAAAYRGLGEGPWIDPEPEGEHFSAREHAAVAAARICRG